KIRIESWQGIGTVQKLERLGLPVELFTPTPKTNAEEWPQLAQRLANGTLMLFPHARLREELLNLTVEVGPTGAKVTDRGKVHQEHGTPRRGVVASLGQATDAYICGVNLSGTPVRTVLGREHPSADQLDANNPDHWIYEPPGSRWRDVL